MNDEWKEWILADDLTKFARGMGLSGELLSREYSWVDGLGVMFEVVNRVYK